jgi:hypothetical protein
MQTIDPELFLPREWVTVINEKSSVSLFALRPNLTAHQLIEESVAPWLGQPPEFVVLERIAPEKGDVRLVHGQKLKVICTSKLSRGEWQEIGAVLHKMRLVMRMPNQTLHDLFIICDRDKKTFRDRLLSNDPNPKCGPVSPISLFPPRQCIVWPLPPTPLVSHDATE